jgi:hypothetical protein
MHFCVLGEPVKGPASRRNDWNTLRDAARRTSPDSETLFATQPALASLERQVLTPRSFGGSRPTLGVDEQTAFFIAPASLRAAAPAMHAAPPMYAAPAAATVCPAPPSYRPPMDSCSAPGWARPEETREIEAPTSASVTAMLLMAAAAFFAAAVALLYVKSDAAEAARAPHAAAEAVVIAAAAPAPPPPPTSIFGRDVTAPEPEAADESPAAEIAPAPRIAPARAKAVFRAPRPAAKVSVAAPSPKAPRARSVEEILAELGEEQLRR